MTLFFWSKDLDPEYVFYPVMSLIPFPFFRPFDTDSNADSPSSYTLPLHSALVDFIGQCLLMLAYEVCIARGMDVQIAPAMAD